METDQPGADAYRLQEARALFVHGEQDMIFPIQVAQRLADAVPNATLAVLKVAGHMAHFKHPNEWSKAVLDFTG